MAGDTFLGFQLNQPNEKRNQNIIDILYKKITLKISSNGVVVVYHGTIIGSGLWALVVVLRSTHCRGELNLK